MRKPRILYGLFLHVTFWFCLLAGAVETAEGPATIRGEIYISPSGKAEGDLVMRAAGVEVILLRGEGSFEAELAALRQSRSPTIARHFQVVHRAQQEFLRSSSSPREEREKKSALLRQERTKLIELREAYEKEVTELLAKHAFARTKTDSEGRFKFAGIPRGHYLIHSHFEIVGMAINYYWLLPVELQTKKEIEVSLHKLNATPLF